MSDDEVFEDYDPYGISRAEWGVEQHEPGALGVLYDSVLMALDAGSYESVSHKTMHLLLEEMGSPKYLLNQKENIKLVELLNVLYLFDSSGKKLVEEGRKITFDFKCNVLFQHLCKQGVIEDSSATSLKNFTTKMEDLTGRRKVK